MYVHAIDIIVDSPSKWSGILLLSYTLYKTQIVLKLVLVARRHRSPVSPEARRYRY